MPSGGDVEVSAKETNQAVVVAHSAGDPEEGLPPLPPLKKIWDFSKMEKGPAVPKKGKTDGWRCGHCGQVFYPVSTPRATYHLAQEDGGSIVVCPAIIPSRGKNRCVFFVLLPFSCTSLTSIDLRVHHQV